MKKDKWVWEEKGLQKVGADGLLAAHRSSTAL
jgi:hypothetical protein